MVSIKNSLFQKNLRYAKKGIIFGVISGMLWGLGGVVISLGFDKEPFISYANLGLYIVPLVIACLTDAFAAITTLFINIYNGKAKEYVRVIKTKPGKIICLASVFGGPLAMSGYYIGLNYAGPFYTMAITAIYPAVGAILSRIFLKEKISKNAWIGIMFCVIGAIVVTYVAPTGEIYPNFKLGIIACLVATLGWGIEGVICAYGMDLVDPDLAIGIRWVTSFSVYFLFILPFVKGFSTIGYELLIKSFTSPWTFILLAGAIVNAISYFLYYSAINMTGVSRALALMITYALWGVVFGWLFSGSATITLNIIIGAIITVIGAGLVAGKPSEIINIREN
ncbi:MAG: DMT family transporter [Eubacteriaceae bacterium]|jgi:drug/metabolite transporter (DMT)-like permease|nr:DMT family transporter [Eubacteriaceae bacterium]